jgi:hypothetical protein
MAGPGGLLFRSAMAARYARFACSRRMHSTYSLDGCFASGSAFPSSRCGGICPDLPWVWRSTTSFRSAVFISSSSVIRSLSLASRAGLAGEAGDGGTVLSGVCCCGVEDWDWVDGAAIEFCCNWCCCCCWCCDELRLRWGDCSCGVAYGETWLPPLEGEAGLWNWWSCCCWRAGAGEGMDWEKGAVEYGLGECWGCWCWCWCCCCWGGTMAAAS